MNVSFGEISRVQTESRRADDAVLALAKLERKRDLTEADRAALRYAREFLAEAKRGSKWLTEKNQKTIEATSRGFFSSFVRAADSLTTGVRSLDTFEHEIESLLRSAQLAASGEPVALEEIQSLRKFFNSIHAKSLDQVDELFKPQPLPQPMFA